MKYAYYLGCVIPSRLNQHDLAVRNISRKLGIELIDLEGAGCCGSVMSRSTNIKANLIMSMRILVLAESKRLDLLVCCPGCYESLTEAHRVFNNDGGFREEANKILEKIDGLTFSGAIKVKHFMQVLYEDVGLEKIGSKIHRPLRGLRVAAHYGCHILRPSSKVKFDHPEDPTILDKLIEVTGAKSIYWTMKLWCCGSPIQVIDRNLSLSLAGMKLKSAKEAGADCIVTMCPSCQLQLDLMQNEASKITGEKYDMPVILYPQLLGLAMGLKSEEVALHLNKTVKERFLELLQNMGGG